MRSKLNLLYLLIFIITLYGCGNDMNTSSNDTGSASFALKWETPSNTPLTKTSDDISSPLVGEGKGEGGLPEFSYAPIDCTAIGVLTVTANVYDSNQAYLINGGPWDCTSHSGTITNVPSGDSRKITVYGKDASDRIIYRGETTGVTITANQTTNAGSVTMSSVASDITAPTDGSLSASTGNSQVSLSWSGFSDSGGIDYYKLVYSTSSTPSSCSGGTQIYLGSGASYTHTGLTNNTTYYYRICAIDNAGNTSSGATTSGTPASSGGTTTTTTTGGETTTSGSAPSAPTNVSALAGNGQNTINIHISGSVTNISSSNIYWSTTSGVNKTNGTKISNITGTSSSSTTNGTTYYYYYADYTHTGLTNGTTYYYVATAVNSYGESSESSQVSVTPWDRTNGLVAYWSFNEDSGTIAADSSGNGWNLSLSGTYGWSYGSLNLMAFDVIGITSSFPHLNTLTAEGWFYLTNDTISSSLSGSIFPYLVNRNNSWAISISSGQIRMRIIDYRTFQWREYDTGYYPAADSWVHIAFSYDSSNGQLKSYINGSLSNTWDTGYGNLWNSGEPFRIGYPQSIYYWKGKIDEVRIYNRVLSTSEISDLYNNP